MSINLKDNDTMSKTSSGLKFETWPIERLIEYARNPRKNDHAVDKIAGAIKEFGFRIPVVAKSDGLVVDGHLRLKAAKKLGLKEIPVVLADDMTEAQIKAFRISVNRMAEFAEWDNELLALELGELGDAGFDLELTGFTDEEIKALMPVEVTEGLTDEDEVPDVPVEPVTKPGDVWLLGRHRVMCGDSTSISDVEKLTAGATAQLLHADPPYGMGKASDGVANDNIYEEALDKFQMEWWATFRTFLTDNASAYIWGNAPDLWRLWYRGGLGYSEKLELRNQIVWDKKAIPGMKSDLLTQYPIASEHCLFFQLGDQYLGNINTEEFPETWEPIRAYFESEANAAGITLKEIVRVCGCQMFGHWFTKSQFTLMPEKHYTKLAAAYPGRFTRPWKQLKQQWESVKNTNKEKRGYFDNAHDIMRDVWEFPRVTGDERHGHATPKPVAMMERVMKSSLPKGGLCLEPFGGSGATLMGAEKTGRICHVMELQPRYVDVIVRRWQDFTGKQAVHAETGKTFEEVANGNDEAKD